MKLEDLRPGAAVISRDGHKVGTLSRFVIDGEPLKLTHIVVDTGIFRSGEPLWKGGWGMSHDRMLPLGALERADSDEIHITMSGDEFKELSADYVEEYFEQAPDAEPGRPDLSDLRRLAMSIPGEPGPYLMRQVSALAPGAMEVAKDSPVWRLKPHEKIGEVERVLFDEETDSVTGLVIRRGFVFTRDVVLPSDYIVEVVADVVRVEIDDASLKSLEHFEPQD